jgi:DNA (cytosine-5)-methyltransferase 1
MPTNKYTVLSLFSGAMGLDLGLESTGRFQILACIEKEPVFCETIRMNQRAGRVDPNLKIYEGDLSDLEHVDPHAIMAALGLRPGELDVLVGGPPCQSFSTAGRRRTTRDPRGTLLWRFLKYVEVLQPKFFVIENVRGLLSAALRHRPLADRPDRGGPPLAADEEPGSVVRLFAHDLQNLNGVSYHLDCFEVNAVNYGAPQLRERVLMFGNRYRSTVDFPDPTHGTAPGLKPWATLGDAIRDVKEQGDVILDFSPRKKRYLSMVPPGSNWRSLPVAIQKESMGKAWQAKGGRSGWWRRLSYDLPSPTLVTMPNHASTALCHPEQVRALTLREYACIQGFPRTWEFAGSPAEQYVQVGNAVPVRLGLVSGQVVVSELDRLRDRDWQLYPSTPEAFRIVYVQSHVRTRKWYKNGSAVVRTENTEGSESEYASPQTLRKVRTLLSSSARPASETQLDFVNDEEEACRSRAQVSA